PPARRMGGTVVRRPHSGRRLRPPGLDAKISADRTRGRGHPGPPDVGPGAESALPSVFPVYVFDRGVRVGPGAVAANGADAHGGHERHLAAGLWQRPDVSAAPICRATGSPVFTRGALVGFLFAGRSGS